MHKFNSAIFIFLITGLLLISLSIKDQPVYAYTDNTLSNLLLSGNVGIGTTEATSSADLTPPEVNITSPVSGSLVTGFVNVLAEAWDDVAISAVEFFIDGRSLGIGNTSPYSRIWDTTKEASDSSHMLFAIAMDTSGNEASSSAVWVTVDNTPPYVNLISPYNNSLVSGEVTLRVDAWDGVGLERVDFYVDQVLIGSASSYPYAVSWDTTALPSGSIYTIQARAYDQVGQRTDSNIVQVTIADTTLPIVSITNPINGANVSGEVNITADALDDVAIDRVEFYVDGNLYTTITNAPYQASWDTAGYVGNTSHSIYAKAYDDSGNIGIAELVNVTVQDIIAPQVAIASPANGAYVAKNSTVTILADASDISGIQKVEFYVNGVLKCVDTTSNYSCNWKVPVKKNITYTLQAKAYDTVLNTAVSTVKVISK